MCLSLLLGEEPHLSLTLISEVPLRHCELLRLHVEGASLGIVAASVGAIPTEQRRLPAAGRGFAAPGS